MFSSRRLKATLLIVTILSAGLVLWSGPFVQNASAQSTGCDYYMETCYGYWRIAGIVCDFYGEDSYICDLAEDYAAWWCDYYECIYCQNCA